MSSVWRVVSPVLIYGSVGAAPATCDDHQNMMDQVGVKAIGPGPNPNDQSTFDGELAWRQYEGGHDVTPNWPYFFQWVARFVPAPPLGGDSGGKK